jgi:hypothetical protein
MLEMSGETQRSLAEAVGTHPTYMNAVLTERPKMDGRPTRGGESLRVSVSEHFGYAYLDFLELGKAVIEGVKVVGSNHPREGGIKKAGEAAGKKKGAVAPVQYDRRTSDLIEYSPESIVAHASSWAEQARKTISELDRLRGAIDDLGCPLTIIDHDAVIRYQNQESRRVFGVVTGTICGDPCLPPVKRVMETGLSLREEVTVRDKVFCLFVSPIRTASRETDGCVVVSMEVNVCVNNNEEKNT